VKAVEVPISVQTVVMSRTIGLDHTGAVLSKLLQLCKDSFNSEAINQENLDVLLFKPVPLLQYSYLMLFPSNNWVPNHSFGHIHSTAPSLNVVVHGADNGICSIDEFDQAALHECHPSRSEFVL
jgi:hypothetical protein